MRGRSLDAALTFDSAGDAQERGLLRALVYDSIRWYLRLDALLDRLLARPGQKLEPEVRALAIVGLCQLLYTEIPAHAAVAETVEAARRARTPARRGTSSTRSCAAASANMHNCSRRSIATSPCALRIRAGSSTRLAADWGEQAAAILAANNQRPPFWVRVNRRRTSGAALSRASRGKRHRGRGQQVRRRGAAARGRHGRRGAAGVRRRRGLDPGRRRAARRATARAAPRRADPRCLRRARRQDRTPAGAAA